MSIDYVVVRCFSCSLFQVDQRKKIGKWVCRVCHEKQSYTRVYAIANKANQLRPIAQKYNMDVTAVELETKQQVQLAQQQQHDEEGEERRRALRRGARGGAGSGDVTGVEDTLGGEDTLGQNATNKPRITGVAGQHHKPKLMFEESSDSDSSSEDEGYTRQRPETKRGRGGKVMVNNDNKHPRSESDVAASQQNREHPVQSNGPTAAGQGRQGQPSGVGPKQNYVHRPPDRSRATSNTTKKLPSDSGEDEDDEVQPFSRAAQVSLTSAPRELQPQTREHLPTARPKQPVQRPKLMFAESDSSSSDSSDD